MSTNTTAPPPAEAIGELVDEPGECRRRHRYRIYYAATGALSPAVFDTAREAREHFDAAPEVHEPMWDAFHSNGLSCLRESQHQECLGVRLDAAREAANTPAATPPPDTALPLVRPLEFPLQEGMLWTAGVDADGRPVADEFQAEWLRVTPYGHWYTSEEQAEREAWLGSLTRCRGCGAVGEFTFELGEQPCDRPATHQVIATALLVSYRRPAPATPRALWIGVAA